MLLFRSRNYIVHSRTIVKKKSTKFVHRCVCVCVFIPSPVKVGTLLSEVPGTPIGASFFEFELKPTGNDSADQTQHEFQHHIV